MSGSHTLEKFLNNIARDVEDPEKRISAWKRNQLRRITNPATRREARSRADLRLSALGSGSDYTVFLDHLGIASLNIGFGGDGGGGVYHSIYDDFHWYSRFGDPDFEYGRALAQAGAAATLRLADATVLPYDFTNLADTIRVYLGELKSLWNDLHDRVEERNRQLDEGVFQATADSRKPTVRPEREAVPPHLNFAPLENAADTLTAAAARYERAARVGSTKLSIQSARELNAHLIRSERALTHADGLPNRPWFKHQIYAPGFYTGYGVKTIPGVRESIEQEQWQQAEAQIGLVAKVLDGLSGVITEAAGVLERAAK
jgi:N-acetylated-alpha-linked acidic dipeptidase